MRKTFLFFVGWLVFLCACHQKDTPNPDHSGLFIKFFGGAKNGSGFSVKESGDGGYIIVGSVIEDNQTDKDLYLVKTDANGNKIWDNTYSGVNNQEGLDVTVDNAGNYLVAGYTTAANDSTNCLVLQYTNTGVLLKTFISGQSNVNERAHFIRVTSDGNILVAGSQQLQGSSSGQLSMFILKTNLDTLIWQKSIGLNALYNAIGTIVETPAKNLLFCGTVNRGNETDVRISMTDPLGNLRWDYSIGENDGISERGMQLQATLDGNYIIGGTQKVGSDSSALLIKIDSLGNALWATQPGGAGKAVYSVFPTTDGGYILAGTASNNYLLMKTDDKGNEGWEQHYGGGESDQANKVIQTSDGGYLMIGTVYVANHTVLGLMKTNSSGKLNP
jgi:hypothetical protein